MRSTCKVFVHVPRVLQRSRSRRPFAMYEWPPSTGLITATCGLLLLSGRLWPNGCTWPRNQDRAPPHLSRTRLSHDLIQIRGPIEIEKQIVFRLQVLSFDHGMGSSCLDTLICIDLLQSLTHPRSPLIFPTEVVPVLLRLPRSLLVGLTIYW